MRKSRFTKTNTPYPAIRSPAQTQITVRCLDGLSLFIALRAIPSIIFQCRPRCRLISRIPQYAPRICSLLARESPLSMGKKSNTCLDRTTPLYICMSITAKRNRSIKSRSIRMGVYLPRNRFLYQFPFNPWWARNRTNKPAPAHSWAVSPQSG